MSETAVVWVKADKALASEIRDLAKLEEGLDPKWELPFVESMATRLKNDLEFSPKMVEKIHQVCQRHL